MTIKANDQKPVRPLPTVAERRQELAAVIEAYDALETPYAVLVEARKICATLERRAIDRSNEPVTPSRAYDLGRVAESWDRAEDAIFDALNVAASYADDEQAALAIRAHRA